MPFMPIFHGFQRPSRRVAFTLIELLVTITIIAVLATILLPVIGSISENGKVVKCASNQRQIGALMQLYLQDHDRTLPLRFYGVVNGEELGYCDLLIPYFDGNTPPSRSQAARKLFTCPSHSLADYPNQPSYGMNWYYDSENVSQIEHPAQTIFVAETYGNSPAGAGSRRADRDNVAGDIGQLDDKRHRGKANYLFFDGHVASMTYKDTRLPTAGAGATGAAAVDFWGTDGGMHAVTTIPTPPWATP